MSELLHLDLQGKTLEEIIMHPTLWAKRIEVAVREGTDALSDLQIQLVRISDPVARARECQVLLALDNPEKAAEVIENETHNLCKAMYLAVKIHYRTLENYLYIIEQPEILTRDRSDLGLESQMRWDFMRAQSFQRVGHSNEALHCHTLAHRIAVSFDINSIVQVSKAQMRSLTPSPVSHKIDALLLQLDEVRKTKDFRIDDYILSNLCILYLVSNDYTSLQKYALELPPGILRDHIILLTNFFLNQKGSATLHPLGHARNQPFCGSGYLLSRFRDFKRQTYRLKERRHLERKLNFALDFDLPDNLNVPILNFIMWSVKVMAYVAAGDLHKAKKCSGQMQYISEMSEITGDLPDWAKYYMGLTKVLLAHSNDEKISENLREDVVEGLGKMESFVNFVTQLCPEIVYVLNQQKQDDILEKVLSEVLVITKEGYFLGKEEVEGFPKIDALVKEVNRWYKGVTKRDSELIEQYEDRLEKVGCKGVVFAWKVEEKKRAKK